MQHVLSEDTVGLLAEIAGLSDEIRQMRQQLSDAGRRRRELLLAAHRRERAVTHELLAGVCRASQALVAKELSRARREESLQVPI